MAFGRDIQYTVSVCIADPQADKTLPIWRVPAEITKIEILEAWVVSDTALSAGTANGRECTLLDGGADASGTSAISNTVGGTDAGGTFAAWTASTPKAFTISEGTLDGGDYVNFKYNETGTDAPKNLLVWFAYVSGVGA